MSHMPSEQTISGRCHHCGTMCPSSPVKECACGGQCKYVAEESIREGESVYDCLGCGARWTQTRYLWQCPCGHCWSGRGPNGNQRRKNLGFLPRLQKMPPPFTVEPAAVWPSTPTSTREDHPEMEVPEVTDSLAGEEASASAGLASADRLANAPGAGGSTPVDLRFLQQETCIVRLQGLVHALHGRVIESENRFLKYRRDMLQLRRLVQDLKVCDGVTQMARGKMQSDLDYLLDNHDDTRNVLQTILKALEQQENLTRLHSMQLQSLGMERAWAHGPADHERGDLVPQWHGLAANQPVAVFVALPM